VARAGTALPAQLRDHPRITCHLLPPGREGVLSPVLLVPVAAARAIAQTLRLVFLFLVVLRKPDVILVQNPPAIPTLLVTLVPALRLGPRHPLVALARAFETMLGRRADAHLSVSEALRRHLE